MYLVMFGSCSLTVANFYMFFVFAQCIYKLCSWVVSTQRKKRHFDELQKSRTAKFLNAIGRCRSIPLSHYCHLQATVKIAIISFTFVYVWKLQVSPENVEHLKTNQSTCGVTSKKPVKNDAASWLTCF